MMTREMCTILYVHNGFNVPDVVKKNFEKASKSFYFPFVINDWQ